MKLYVEYTVELTNRERDRLVRLADQVGIQGDTKRATLLRLFQEYGRGCLGMAVEHEPPG